MLFCMDTQLKKWRFTEYGNRIGLMLAQSGEVVLSFPFKDAILEGGMSREDTGREERFFHLSQDRSDIDTLQERKVLTGFRRIDSSGDHEITSPEEVEFFDNEWELRSNLLIKGNNLVALYTLRDRLAGKVKLIYIDPPYNTGNDGFRYNDNFNHSTWLAFMKNRLEIARELLRDDGVIFVQCDDNEQAYLKVLMDEVFGRENFVGDYIWKNKLWWWNDSSIFVSEHEYTVVFAKVISNITPFTELNVDNGKYLYEDEFVHERGKYAIEALYRSSIQFSESLFYPIEAPDGTLIYPNESDKNSDKHIWRWSKQTFEKKKSEGRIEFKKTKNGWRVFSKQYFLQDDDWNERRLKSRSIIDFIGNRQWTEHLKDMFGGKFFNNPKPEEIIEYFVQISTQPWDIVLDYHLGSGTTAAVAHKMGRRWIGIEQMDYIQDIAKVRLQKVIEGEQGGISKNVGWQWGGEFVYLELKTYNGEYLERIELARTKEELHRVYADMARNAFLQFWFDRRDFERDGYKALPLEEQRVKLREILDLNHLYLNYQDMRDARHRVSPIDQSLTDAFYGS